MFSGLRFRTAMSSLVILAANAIGQGQPTAISPVSDSNEQEARKLYDRGCVLAALGRYKEALPILEKAVSQIPSLDGTCTNKTLSSIERVRSDLQSAQRALSDCLEKYSQSPDTRRQGKKRPQQTAKLPPSTARQICLSTHGYEAGEYTETVSAITKSIETNARASAQIDATPAREFARAGLSAGDAKRANDSMSISFYTSRALALFAIGNSIAALRDLEASMDLAKSDPSIDEFKYYFYRAVILSDAGNTKGALDDCRTVLTFKNFALLPYAQPYCMKLIVDDQLAANTNSPLGSSALPASPNTTLRSEVEEVEKSGRFMALPSPQVTKTQVTGASSGLTTNATRVVRNGTSYQLRVVFTGPMDREITVEPGASQTIILTPGQYKVLGRVSAPNVSPFLGPQTYNSGETYTSQFVIR